MKTEQYTPDAICESMGIGPLIGSTWDLSTQVLRLLLKPSFDPEVCITIVSKQDFVELSVVALSESLWHQESLCRLPNYQETARIDEDDLIQLLQIHEELATKGPQSICLDGMGINTAWKTQKGSGQFNSHVASNAVQSFESAFIDCAWRSTTGLGVRNGLARCGRYVGLEYPLGAEPLKPKYLRIGVLGKPDDMANFNSQIDRNQSKI